MAEFSRNLNGANCTVGGQAIISLQVTEDVDADYDTASAMCLAPGGPHAKGSVVQTVEGGVPTGYWHVDRWTKIKSGERTWRRKRGSSFTHLPLVQYQLRRAGYLQARATITPTNVSGAFPVKFCPQMAFTLMQTDMFMAVARRELTWEEYWANMAGWRPVGSAADIIRIMCGWVGLPVSFRCSLPELAPEYMPIGKPVITACREVAEWSGASVCLGRTGTLVVYDWQDTYSRAGRSVPMPATVLYEELGDAIYSANAVRVIGTERWWGATPSIWNTETRTFEGGGWGWKTRAVEVCEFLAGAPGERVVEERMEISDYFITPDLARRLARGRLARIALEAGMGRWRGPAEGSQAYRPLDYHVTSVSRSLEWTGSFYRYETEITGPTTAMVWGGGGWDF